MINDNAKKFDEVLRSYKRNKRRMSRDLGGEAVTFFKKSFRQQGFKHGGTIDKWEKRGSGPENRKGRALLIKSGKLRRAIKVTKSTSSKVIIGVDRFVKAYASTHNYGDKIKVTKKSRAFFWAMFKKTGDPFYKGMALTKKNEIVIPKRQFMGESSDLDAAIIKKWSKILKSIFK